MPITEADWKAHTEHKAKDLDADRTVNLNYLRQSALLSEQVTNHPAWDHYLQKLQAWLEDTQREITVIHDLLATPINDERVRLSYTALNVLTERKRILTACMNLPKEIIAHAHDHGFITH